MRKVFVLLWMVGVPAAAVQAPAPAVQKIVIVALIQDGARAVQVESGLKDRFVERGIKADSLHTLFEPHLPVHQMITQLRDQGYDSLLCIAPRKSIQLYSSTAASAETDMRNCLTTYSSGTFTTGDLLEVTPIGETPTSSMAQTPNNTAQGSLRSPIPSNPKAAPYRVSKGTLRLYDMASGKLVWKKDVQAKTPAELRTTLQTEVIVHEVWNVIAKSPILPPQH